jgi:uncharacterized protein YutE (UPF0331/DUF86 family)
MKKMVGFRNTAVHQYQGLNLDIIKAVITSGLDDLLDFTQSIIKHHKPQNPL